uniref:Putative secreted protein n=1 Tax=Anopheles triannulatus TaxID=58253 RepID=A0A2M4B0U3_9DIPT
MRFVLLALLLLLPPRASGTGVCWFDRFEPLMLLAAIEEAIVPPPPPAPLTRSRCDLLVSLDASRFFESVRIGNLPFFWMPSSAYLRFRSKLDSLGIGEIEMDSFMEMALRSELWLPVIPLLPVICVIPRLLGDRIELASGGCCCILLYFEGESRYS